MLRMTGTVNSGWKSLTWLQVKKGFKQLVKKTRPEIQHLKQKILYVYFSVSVLLCDNFIVLRRYDVKLL